MVKFTNAQKVLNVGIVLDESHSMSPFTQEVTDCINMQLDTLRKDAKDTKVTVSLLTFSTSVNPPSILFQDISTIGKMEKNSYKPNGWTALYDAMNDMMMRLPSKDINLLLVITDGEENHSKLITAEKLKKKIKENLATDRWTFAVCVPPGYKNKTADQLGIPAGCIMEWEASKQGFAELQYTVTTNTSNYLGGITRGQTFTADFFSPDITNLKVSEVKRNLDNVTKQYVKCYVHNHDDLTISNFVRSKGYTFMIGNAYYQLTKKERIQDYKNLILMNNTTGELFTGIEVRSIVNIPDGGTIELHPSFSPKWTVFVRSTSWNRKLVPGTTLLYKC